MVPRLFWERRSPLTKRNVVVFTKEDMGGTRALLGEAQPYYRDKCCSIQKRRYGWYQVPSGRGPALLAGKTYCKEMVVFKKEDMGGTGSSGRGRAFYKESCCSIQKRRYGWYWDSSGRGRGLALLKGRGSWKEIVVFKKEDTGGTRALLEEAWPS